MWKSNVRFLVGVEDFFSRQKSNGPNKYASPQSSWLLSSSLLLLLSLLLLFVVVVGVVVVVVAVVAVVVVVIVVVVGVGVVVVVTVVHTDARSVHCRVNQHAATVFFIQLACHAWRLPFDVVSHRQRLTFYNIAYCNGPHETCV
ncbi:unnamed protein product [Polarella glacialis]|uniref:Uncharacterized protein n=1 Tax=Polarella glacialis TaxID=89957 RepID=A0A813DJW9_POLGL|nr:unnamed protein product [Polarella glacialis]